MSAVVPAATPDAAVSPPLRVLRLLPAPLTEPPYDDELAARPTLRLVPAHRPRAPARPLPAQAPSTQPLPAQAPPAQPLPALPPVLRPVVPAPGRTRLDDECPASRVAEPLPASRPFAHAFVQRLLEVCAGVRPLSQLRPDTTPDLYDTIQAQLEGRPRMTAPRPTRRDVRSIHVQERPEGIAEVCATVLRAGRAGALALRIEGHRGRWLCTELVGL